MDIYTAEPLVPEPGLVELEIFVGKFKLYTSAGTDQTLAKLIKGGVKRYVLRCTNLFFLYGIRRNCHSSGRNLFLYHFIKRVITRTNNYEGISLLSTAYKIFSNILLAWLTPYGHQILGDHQCGLGCKIFIPDRIFHIRQTVEKIWKYNGRCISYLYMSRKPMTQKRSPLEYSA
jgi:hypothetical protein